MANPSPVPEDVRALRQLMQAFVKERLQAKLDKLREDDHEKRQELQAAYQLPNWLADAARRVSQIQLATHTLKPLHPDARGTNIHVKNASTQDEQYLIGTHSLSGQYDDDVVGNAAALDVFKFLKLSHGGKTLLERVLDADPSIQAALSDDQEQARQWLQAFAGITQSKTDPASHTLAKQMYFPLPEEGAYHLLAPLFPTSLVHAVHTTIREDRFGEAAKAAREARFNEQAWQEGYREYPNLAIQKFGGTKPQNISQLNSERYGENWLLPSLPPVWRSVEIKAPLNIESVFGRWLLRRRTIFRLMKTLREFLRKTTHNNKAIRQTRADLVARICDEVLAFAAELRELPPGWSAQPECKLDENEALWLDQRRQRTDEEFRKKLIWGDWQGEVCARFGHWLNTGLETKRTPMGADEFQQWKGDLDAELRLFRRELSDAD
ncbi:MAG: type I-F CRISPR-associated protein Csy1 [Candidatus Competibacteraceae bacterium]|nr:type I-F CRISPR-associated protein Csy1 [Candidatus Competibacteraceae bacterium]